MTDYAFTHLRHVALAVPDYEKQLDFYTHQWGLSVAGTDGDTTYLAAEGSPEQYVVRIRKATDKRLDLISYGAADAATVDGLAEKLGRGGVQLVNEPGTLQTPRSAGTARSKRASPFRSNSRMWWSTPPTRKPQSRSTRSTSDSTSPTS